MKVIKEINLITDEDILVQLMENDEVRILDKFDSETISINFENVPELLDALMDIIR